jgi:hypothetical protein
MKVVNLTERWIGYRLNILGIRVWKEDCQLVAKTSGDRWETIGPRRTLPVHIPQNVEQFKDLGADSLQITAYQYAGLPKNSDLVEVLSQQKDFEAALRDSVDLFVS